MNARRTSSVSGSRSRARARDWQRQDSAPNIYVSRAALKLDSVAKDLKLDFRRKIVLDVGSSTGGFSDYALQHGAHKVIAVDSGTNQLHPKLRADKRLELHEKTDIREFATPDEIDVVLIDVSFISLRKILPNVARLAPRAAIVAMLKPQFEATDDQKVDGIIKNSAIRREIIKSFESWLKANNFVIQSKQDSHVAGTKGNVERFYLIQKPS